MNSLSRFLTGLACAYALSAQAQSTAFTHQGRLNDGGAPANGWYDLRFRLFDAPTGGVSLDDPITELGVPVTNGLFAVSLDFGLPLFNGNDRWLEVSVRTNSGAGAYTILMPRQPITPTPYALHAFNAGGLMSFGNAPLDIKVNGQRAWRIESTTGDAPNIVGGYADNSAAAGLEGVFIGGGGLYDGSDGNYPNRVLGSFGAIVGGWGNRVNDESGFIGGGENNRIALGAFTSAIVGGHLNRIEDGSPESFIGGGRYNGIERDAMFSVVSGGYQNTVLSNSPQSTIGGGYWNFLGASSRAATISGGAYNRIGAFAAASTIGGGLENTISNNSLYSAISGGSSNGIAADAEGTFIGGGVQNGVAANTRFVTIGGGWVNHVAPGVRAGTVAGGEQNRILTNGTFAAVGGGGYNIASGFGSVVAGGGGLHFEEGNENRGNTAAGRWSAVVGGADNVAANLFSLVAGGEANRAEGDYAVVPGGLANRAAGLLSFAAGWGAQALHNGAWVWADNSPTLGGPPLASTTNNQFTARAAGGVRFFTDKEATTGVELLPGSGSWSMLSDRNAKENFARANGRDILDKLAALPLATWNYKTQDESVRHIGPTAQDFHAAFGLGEDERRISSVDADGVALAAIQALNEKVEEENRALRAELQAKDSEIQTLRNGLAALRKLIEEHSAARP